MDLEIINKLYLELSQVATAKTKREAELEDLLVSARAIAERRGEGTAWEVFSNRLANAGIGCVTAKVFKVQDSHKDGYCDLCGLPMLPSESMFKFHGYSETCEQAAARNAAVQMEGK